MQYRYVLEQANYEDLASGRVLYYQRGTTAFPARLASEIFQWCKADLAGRGSHGPYCLYDPCCGGAYLLTSLGFLHRDSIDRILASDIDLGLVALAADNLGLLTVAGMERRMGQLEAMLAAYGKLAHSEAIASAVKLRAQVATWDSPVRSACFRADATQPAELARGASGVDLVIVDMPYGNMVDWGPSERDGVGAERGSAFSVLDALRVTLSRVSVVAIVAQKGTPISHPSYDRVKRFTIGKRQVMLLRPT